MKRVWKEIVAFLLTFGPALLAVVLDAVSRQENDEEENGEGG